MNITCTASFYDKHIRFVGALILLEKIFFRPRKLCYYYSSSLFTHVGITDCITLTAPEMVSNVRLVEEYVKYCL